MEEKRDWGELLQEALVALRKAHAAMDDLAGWSGSSGNWPLQESFPKVEKALAMLEDACKPPKYE